MDQLRLQFLKPPLLRTTFGEIPDKAGEEALTAYLGFADGKLHRKGRAVTPLSDHDAADFQRAGTLARRGETRRIEVRDVSLGAVSIECELPDAMIGEPVELAIDGLSFRLGGVVARMDRGSVLISLNLTAEIEQELTAILAAERARPAAA